MQQAVGTARQIENVRQIRCQFCKSFFVPEPDYKRQGKIITKITVCPICGNGVEKRFTARWYKNHKKGGGKNG